MFVYKKGVDVLLLQNREDKPLSIDVKYLNYMYIDKQVAIGLVGRVG
jgi:hypothetical protein